MFETSSMNPMSNILSTSSRTSQRTPLREMLRWRMWSRSLPGVATTASTPARSALICLSMFTPPWTSSGRSEVYFENFSKASALWAASSRVGLKTRIRGPDGS